MLARAILPRFWSSLQSSSLSTSTSPCCLLCNVAVLRTRVASTKADRTLAKRSWTVPLSHSSPKVGLTSHTMAQTGETGTSLIVVYITVPNKETATKLALGLVNNKLAACVNQVPGIVSTYMWEGKVETDEEILLIVKTRQSLLEALTIHVKANHPYSVPEVVALPILGGSETYLKWVTENTLKQDS